MAALRMREGTDFPYTALNVSTAATEISPITCAEWAEADIPA